MKQEPSFPDMTDKMPNILNKWVTRGGKITDEDTIDCADCGLKTDEAMCAACVEKMGDYLLSKIPKSNVPQLKLFEVTVHPHPAAGPSVRTAHVLLLAKGLQSAEKSALDRLRMADPGGRIQMSTREITGPFRDGYILHARDS